jgi:hypothetical protein
LKKFDKGLHFFLFLTFAIALNSHRGFPGEGGEIRVQNIEPSLNQNYLAVSAVFQNLFSPKIVGTIQSGLPSIIEIEIKLLQEDKRSVLHKRFTRTISYNIWEERYTINSEDTTNTFYDFEEAKKFSSEFKNLALIEKNNLDENAKYKFLIRVGIIPISTMQAEKVTDWLRDPNQSEEYLASDDRASGFKLNLNKLVSFFVGNKKRSQYSSSWYSSDAFRIKELK